MTEQYQQYNINEEPVQPRAIVSTVAEPTGTLLAGDGLVSVDTTLSVFTATLPASDSCPGRTITVVNDAAVPLGLTLAVAAPDVFVPAAGPTVNPILASGGTITVRSNGTGGWVVISETP